MSSVLELRELAVGYAGTPVLTGVSISLEQGKIGCFLGASGCGKTTLLRAIAGFEPPLSGEVWIAGTCVSAVTHQMPTEQRNVGMVFQDYALFPHLSVRDNIAFGLRRSSAGERTSRVSELLALTGLQPCADAYPHTLSGGQQQRVALARAMAPRPAILLLDEPFSQLDVELREDLAIEVREILSNDGITAILVSHNQPEAFAMADAIGVIHAQRVVQWGSAYNLYHQPSSPYVAEFVGAGYMLTGSVIDPRTVTTAIGDLSGRTLTPLAAGTAVSVLLRPDDLVYDANGPLVGRLIDKIFRGAQYLYTIEFAEGVRLASLVPSHHKHAVGDQLRFHLDLEHLIAFAHNEEKP